MRDTASIVFWLALPCCFSRLALLSLTALPRRGAQAGLTALHHAAGLDAGGTRLQALLMGKADVGAVDLRGRTALHVCAEQGQARKARALLDAGANSAVKDAQGRTPAELATASEHSNDETRELFRALK